MAAAKAMADRHLVSLILLHLSDMKYKTRCQQGPDQPVEFLEFRPTLVPSIVVNKLWTEEGTTVLWKGYPHLPALKSMSPDRRQWYANKVQRLFVAEPPSDSAESLTYLEGLNWPKLKTLELEVDWKRQGKSCETMLHADLEHLEFSGPQSGDSNYIARTVLPALIAPCTNLRSVQFGPDAIDLEDPVHSQELADLLDSRPSIKDVRVMNANFFGKDSLFGRLSQCPSLESLEIDLDPGLQLLSLFSGPTTLPSSFASLKRLHIMCYPEIALALPVHLRHIEELQLDLARIPNEPLEDSDISILDDLLGVLPHCPELLSLRVNVGQLASNFPSVISYPFLSGMALVKLATSCPKLQEISLLVSEPGAIDASGISSLHFEAFCGKLPRLRNLTLKIHPQTAIDLEPTALQSLGRHCPHLEMLRLKASLQVPSLQMPPASSPVPPNSDQVSLLENPGDNNTLDPPYILINTHHRSDSLDIENLAGSTTPSQSLFPRLTHLALARPQSILSIASDTYTMSSASHSSSIVDPLIEEDLVQSWAQPLSAHFPRLEILEAWSDWTGQDNESLTYFMPLQEVLASTWEFLSGVEQDLWEDGEDQDEPNTEWEGSDESRISFDSHGSGDDWEMASLINEFPVEGETAENSYLEVYEEEPEGTITPGRTVENGEGGYFRAH